MQQIEINDRWMSVVEIAQYLGVSKETIYRWVEQSKMPAHRIGKFWKFKITEIDAWIKGLFSNLCN